MKTISAILYALIEVVLLASMLFIVGEAGAISGNLAQFIGSTAAIFACVIHLKGSSLSRFETIRILGLGVGLAILAPMTNSSTSLFLPFGWCALIYASSKQPRYQAKRLFISYATLCLVICGIRIIPELGWLWRLAADGVSAITGSISGEEQLYGPSILCFPAFVLLFGYGISLALGRKQKLVLWAATVAATVVGLLLAFNCLADWAAPRYLESLDIREDRDLVVFLKQSSILIPLSVRLRIFAGFIATIAGGLLLVSMARMILGSAQIAQPQESNPLPRTWKLATALLACGIFFGAMFIPTGAGNQKILLSDNGRYDFDVPDFENYGGRSAGMFGIFPDMLRRLHYDVEVTEINEEKLAGKDMLICINRRDPFTSDEIKNVHQFVENGGQLLILGDHTRFEKNDPYNIMLAPMGIQYRFDTAQPFDMGWPNSLEFTPGMLPVRPKRSYRVYHWVGASLDIAPSVRPLLIGRYAFADYGVEEAIEMNKLGDRRANPGERIGDLVLAASTEYGQGRVTVFADTTTFQNKQSVQTWEYISGVMSFATAKKPWRAWSWLSCALFVGGLLLWIFLVLKGHSSLLLQTAPLACVTILTLSNLLVSFAFPPTLADSKTADRPLAIIDFSHGERLVFDSMKPTAVDGLVLNCLRNGHVPITEKDDLLRNLDSANLVFLSSPSIPFSDYEIDRLDKFVQLGGKLFLSVGYEESVASLKLLDHFEMKIGSAPIGKVEPLRKPARVGVHEGWPVSCQAADAEVLLEAFGQPVCVRRKIGKGSITVVGDSSFFQSQNLETSGRSTQNGYSYNVSLSNVSFLRHLIENN